MTIEIDDSGTGELVGSAFIGLRKVETDQIIFKELPVELFGEREFASREPQRRVIDLVEEGLKELYHQEGEEIKTCSSPFFEELRQYFREKNFIWEDVKIEDPLQRAVELKYLAHLKSIGVDTTIDKSVFTLNPEQRNKALKKWVCKDFENRIQFLKLGFKKAFRKLKEQCFKIKTLLDPISTIYNYCDKKGFYHPKFYPLNFDDESLFKIGVSIRPVLEDFSLHYSNRFEDELECKNAITGTGYDLNKRGAKRQACEEVCDKLGLKYLI